MHDDGVRAAARARRPFAERNQGAARLPASIRSALRPPPRSRRHLGCKPGYIGRRSVRRAKVRIVADRTVAAMSDFVCGANEEGFHLTGRELGPRRCRNRAGRGHPQRGRGRPQPGRQGPAAHPARHRGRPHLPAAHQVFRGAEGDVPGRQGQQPRPMEMGCYGIGVTRIVGGRHRAEPRRARHRVPAPDRAFRGLPGADRPTHKNAAVREAADQLYAELLAAGVDVLLDDRDERPGVLFADMDLIGIPHRLVLSERGLAAGTIEYKGRTQQAADNVAARRRAAVPQGAVRLRMRTRCPGARPAAAPRRSRTRATRSRRSSPTACARSCAARSPTAPCRSSASTAAPTTRTSGSTRCRKRLQDRMPDRKHAHRVPEDRALRGQARRPRPADGARPDPGRIAASASTRYRAPARAATCR